MSDERIAKLETYREGDIATLRSLSEKMDLIGEDVSTIRLQLEKQKGFLSGAMFIILPLWSVFTVTATSLWDRITSQ